KQQRSRRNGTENAQQSERYQSAYSNRLKEAYKILGLKEKALLEEVKTAYRTQVKTCHPDTLPLTATEAEREEAAIRFRSLTEAYDFLCEELVAEPVSVAK
ncbi:MAG: J domain-containing protein, partial [Paludibacteraceae bacterium]|nr:J domain-containing protein [Paludibacteraceae bacterium]